MQFEGTGAASSLLTSRQTVLGEFELEEQAFELRVECCPVGAKQQVAH